MDYLPTEVAPFGIGGTAQIRSESGEPMLLFTEVATATYVVNTSPVPLYVLVGARYRDITQPGRGRPSMVTLEHPNNNSSVIQFNTVTPRVRDLDFALIAYMEPGDYVGLKFGKSVFTTTTPYMNIIASDDVGQLEPLNRPPRDDYEAEETAHTNEEGVFVAKWSGTSTASDVLGAGDSLDGIPGVTYNPTTGVVTNFGDVFGYVLMAGQVNGGAWRFIRAGRSDGVLNSSGRTFMWIEFDPNAPQASDFMLIPNEGVQVQISITFYPDTYDARYGSS
jgi:hypothetical protein